METAGSLTIQSTALITSNGGNGNAAFPGGSGGGSGGGIFIHGDTVTIAGTVEANGGEGGGGGVGGLGIGIGGGGGGGLILFPGRGVLQSERHPSPPPAGRAASSIIIWSEPKETTGSATPSAATASSPFPPPPPARRIRWSIPSPATATPTTSSSSSTIPTSTCKSSTTARSSKAFRRSISTPSRSPARAKPGFDSLTVDYTNGFIALPISFDGGAGNGSHSLSVVGSADNDFSTNDVYTPGPATGAGTLAISLNSLLDTQGAQASSAVDSIIDGGGSDSTITFVNLTPVLDTVPGTLTVAGTNGNDVITYSQGTQNPTDDGLVTVNNLESIEFSNKTTLNINTGLGIDTFIDDQPANVPTGLVNAINLTGGDDNNVDTLIYQAVPDSENVLDAFGQGFGEVGPFFGDNAADVAYSGIGTIDFNGQLTDSDQLDIEGEPLSFNDFTVFPASVIGSGRVTGSLDTNTVLLELVKPSETLEDATYTIPTVNYAGLSPFEVRSDATPAISGPYSALNFDALDEGSAAFVIYNGLRGGEINVYGNTFTDGYADDDVYQSIGIFGDEPLAATQFNLKADSSIYFGVGELGGFMTAYVDGDGIGSSDYMEFDGDGANPIDLDPSGNISEENVGDNVFFGGITSFSVYADSAPVNLNGNNYSGNATITPVDPPAEGAADISVGTLYTQFYVDEVTVLTVNGGSSAGTDSVTVDGTNTNDSIVAAPTARPRLSRSTPCCPLRWELKSAWSTSTAARATTISRSIPPVAPSLIRSPTTAGRATTMPSLSRAEPPPQIPTHPARFREQGRLRSSSAAAPNQSSSTISPPSRIPSAAH